MSKNASVTRVQITAPPPGKRLFEVGRFYLLDTEEAKSLIGAGFAMDPENPPPAPEPEQAPLIVVPLVGGEE